MGPFHRNSRSKNHPSVGFIPSNHPSRQDTAGYVTMHNTA